MSRLGTTLVVIGVLLSLQPDPAQATVIFEEHFDTDVIGSGDWIASDASATVDLANGWLHIASNGSGSDESGAYKLINLDLPIIVEARMRLVSAGQNYTMPALGLAQSQI